ncbi:flagellar protein FliS [Thermosulfidibacter takaii ABI70S6]|uniref:Flagellar secretion chaperone FliS n=1 Tax=Thermosulfidibacter takaii (strain DSM 17441 / JCM 13301 / NBRC 103674 / ABI70S6) TaxID=1298851 RepID=A0A0S3QSR6_THET7|nr:flagellar export chaperone FliS [Thermosulfidibacter takaii]BAT71392.1 flagellar protein FliS [Thermosulfidibacter takaii ABI70S6]
MVANPYLSYQKAHVETADRGTLLLLLYDAAIRFIKEAREEMEEENYAEAFSSIARVDRIVKELLASLDMEKGGEIAKNLFKLYEFVLWKLFEAERDRNISHLDEAMHVLDELRSAWKEALEKQKPNSVKVSVKKEDKETASVSIVG